MLRLYLELADLFGPADDEDRAAGTDGDADMEAAAGADDDEDDVDSYDEWLSIAAGSSEGSVRPRLLPLRLSVGTLQLTLSRLGFLEPTSRLAADPPAAHHQLVGVGLCAGSRSPVPLGQLLDHGRPPYHFQQPCQHCRSSHCNAPTVCVCISSALSPFPASHLLPRVAP
jgi:hypothetical protein